MPKGTGKLKGRTGGGRMKAKSKSHWAAKAGLGKAATRAFQIAGLPPPTRTSGAPGAGSKGVKSKKQKAKGKRGANAMVPYKPGQRILLVGEGNFSFAAALTKICGGASGIDATAYDSEADAGTKYPDLEEHTATVLGTGGAVHFGVNGVRLHDCRELTPPYDSVVFNFPHCGLGVKDKVRSVAMHQQLVIDFARSAAQMIHERGEIHITVKRGEPYDTWAVPKVILTELPALRLKNSFDFDPLRYPGYTHRRTLGFEEGISAEGNDEIVKEGSKTYIFSARPPEHT